MLSREKESAFSCDVSYSIDYPHEEIASKENDYARFIASWKTHWHQCLCPPQLVIIFVLLTWSLASDWFPQSFAGWSTTTYWLAAFVSTFLLFVCVLLHELAHALVARAYKLKVKSITLFLFGGMAEIDQEMKRPGVESGY